MKPGVDPRPVPGVQYDFLDVNGRRKWRNNHGGNAGARVAAAVMMRSHCLEAHTHTAGCTGAGEEDIFFANLS